MKIVGQRLRALRESVKMSQAKIGALFGCKQSSINRYESGEASQSLQHCKFFAGYASSGRFEVLRFNPCINDNIMLIRC